MRGSCCVAGDAVVVEYQVHLIWVVGERDVDCTDAAISESADIVLRIDRVGRRGRLGRLFWGKKKEREGYM